MATIHEDVEKASVSSQTPSSQSTVASGNPIDRTLHGWRLAAVQFSLCFGLLLSVMDSSIVATALVVIAREFEDFVNVQWIVLSYLLTYLGFALLFARISDIIGRKWTTFTAYCILTAFSLACGLAQNMNQLIAFRALQGLGSSGLYAMPMTALPEITPKEKFGIMSGIIGAVFALSAILGPLIGGVITTQSSWRWIFLLNVPCGVVLLVVIFFSWPNKRGLTHISWTQLDYFGSFLYLTGSILLVFALQEGGTGLRAWNSPTIVVCLVFAIVAFVAFAGWVWYFTYRPKSLSPIFPAYLLKRRVMATVIWTTTLTGFSFYVLVIQLPERFQIVNGTTAEKAGINLLPLLCASALGSGLGGFLSQRKGFAFYSLLTANGLIFLGCGLLSSISDTRTVKASQYGFQIIAGLGFGLTFSTATVMTKLQNVPKDQAAAQGLMAQTRIFGGSIGLAGATIILNQRLSSELKGVLSPSELSGLRQSLTSIETFTPSQVQAVVGVFAEAFRWDLRMCTIVAGISFVACFFAWQREPPTFANWDQGQIQAEDDPRTAGPD